MAQRRKRWLVSAVRIVACTANVCVYVGLGAAYGFLVSQADTSPQENTNGAMLGALFVTTGLMNVVAIGVLHGAWWGGVRRAAASAAILLTTACSAFALYGFVIAPSLWPVLFIGTGALSIYAVLLRSPIDHTMNTCPKCEYDLAGLRPGSVCPECGTATERNT